MRIQTRFARRPILHPQKITTADGIIGITDEFVCTYHIIPDSWADIIQIADVETGDCWHHEQYDLLNVCTIEDKFIHHAIDKKNVPVTQIAAVKIHRRSHSVTMRFVALTSHPSTTRNTPIFVQYPIIPNSVLRVNDTETHIIQDDACYQLEHNRAVYTAFQVCANRQMILYSTRRGIHAAYPKEMISRGKSARKRARTLYDPSFQLSYNLVLDDPSAGLLCVNPEICQYIGVTDRGMYLFDTIKSSSPTKVLDACTHTSCGRFLDPNLIVFTARSQSRVMELRAIDLRAMIPAYTFETQPRWPTAICTSRDILCVKLDDDSVWIVR